MELNTQDQLDIIREVIVSSIGMLDHITNVVDGTGNTSKALKTARKCCCFMHDETKPSFTWYPETKTVSCFGTCHIAGNVIRFHEFYLKHLAKNNIKKYYSITDLEPSDIDENTAMADLIRYYKLSCPKVFVNRVIQQTKSMNEYEDMINSMISGTNRSSEKLVPIQTYKTAVSQVNTKLRKLRELNYEKYEELEVKKLHILTKCKDENLKIDDLVELSKEI